MWVALGLMLEREIGNLLPNNQRQRIVPHTVPGVGRQYEHFPDGFELHLLNLMLDLVGAVLARLAGVSNQLPQPLPHRERQSVSVCERE